ncbi:uncharacterized protein BP5553_07450 [Venustampulla echinocandica]|uniref:DUF6594 domain-containing protein n=1 Tax=Venustampulla echinocandica TaxID=2656787 RepID=A0A370TGJ8_9HELO|nr:uncharacterized protein BP5553_07450 [Venustampulla echinocandica]RDL34322.1 hypothetical protein BP5553_07450 [Venustampulla echinocandica]
MSRLESSDNQVDPERGMPSGGNGSGDSLIHEGGTSAGQSWIPKHLFPCVGKQSNTPKPRLPGVIVPKTLKEYAKGYPRLAAFLDIDENFMLYRRFGVLQARILLYKQDELRGLEEKLDRKDKVHSDPELLLSRERQDQGGESRKELMREIGEAFKDYAQLLAIARDIATLSQPPPSDYMSVYNYFQQNRPLCQEEAHIYHQEDLVALKPAREHSCLDSLVEKMFRKLRPNTRIHDRRGAHTGSTEKGLVLFDIDRVNRVVSIIVTMAVVGLLMAPVCPLWKLTREQTKISIGKTIAVMFGFTSVFSGMLFLVTRAKRQEIMSAAAAYAAVLMVFLGSQVSPTNGG